MTYSPLTTWVRSVAIATIATSILLFLVIITAEEIPELKDWLKQTFYHHWVGKGVLLIGLFTVSSWAFRFKSETIQLSTIIFIEAIAVIISVFIIALFFLLHTFGIV